MRIATMIIGFLLGVGMFIQTMAVYTVGNAVNSMDNTAVTDDEMGALAVAVLVAIVWLVGIAFAYGFPWVSVVMFLFAALLAFAISGDFPDMSIWGTVSIALAVMSFFGQREKKRKDIERQEQREAMAALRSMQQPQA